MKQFQGSTEDQDTVKSALQNMMWNMSCTYMYAASARDSFVHAHCIKLKNNN